MGDERVQSKQPNVFEHLHAALEVEDADEKNYHIRQTLQLLGIKEVER